MFKQNLKISFRHLRRSKLYTAINIIGLCAGITCMLFALMYWKDEHGYDDFHKNNPSLYRVTTTFSEAKGESVQTFGGTGQVQGPAFKQSVPEIKNFVRVMGGDIYSDIIANEKSLHLQPLFVDPSFLSVFSFPLLRGNPNTALNDINSVIITETVARKFFNSIDVIGKPMQMDADPSFDKLKKALVISGVVQDPPNNSSLQFDALFPMAFMQLAFVDNTWLNAYLGTFVLINPATNINSVTEKLNRVYRVHAKEQLANNIKLYGYDPGITYGLQPMTDIHLNVLSHGAGNAEGGIINGSNPVYSYMFLGISSFILLMAGINFISISMAASLKRSKEVGIRKIAGSRKRQLILQFLSESSIQCLTALLLSVAMVILLLPLFNTLTGKHLHFLRSLDIRLMGYFVLLLVTTILLTGLYPAYILSNFKPVEVLYNRQRLSGRNLLGKSLVVLQFSLAIFLLIATLVYYRQMSFIRNKNLGYNPEQIINAEVQGNRDYKTVTTYIKNELKKDPSISMVSFGSKGAYPDQLEVNDRQINVLHKSIDENYLPLMQIPLQAGRNFSTQYPTDQSEAAIINEAFIETAGLANPIGTRIKIHSGNDGAMKTIVGVVKDFNTGSLRERIKPMVMFITEVPDGNFWVKFHQPDQKNAIAALQKVYKSVLPSAVFQYNFLDEINARQYVQEQHWQTIISVATIISLIICSLGLFGLAHLSMQQRIKEIGIRKVLGATVKQVVVLLSGDFLKLVIVAFVITAPFTWFAVNKWLLNYAYRISVGPLVFIEAAALVMFVALSAVSFQSVKAALSDPVDSLRNQ